MSNKKTAELVIDAFDMVLRDLRGQIVELQGQILLLKKEKRKYLEESSIQRSHKAKRPKGWSIRSRVIAAIQKTTGTYKIDDLIEIVNGDGGKPVSRDTLATTHSLLHKKGGYFTTVGVRSRRNIPCYYLKFEPKGE